MIEQIRRTIAFFVYPEISGESHWEESYKSLSNLYISAKKELEERRQREEIDPKDIMRELVGAIPLNMETMNDVENGLTESQRKNLHLWGYQLAQTEEWKHVRAFSLNKHAAKTLQEMLKHERHAWFGGGVLNGIMFIDELVEALSAAHEQDIAPEEAFDANSAIQD